MQAFALTRKTGHFKGDCKVFSWRDCKTVALLFCLRIHKHRHKLLKVLPQVVSLDSCMQASHGLLGKQKMQFLLSISSLASLCSSSQQTSAKNMDYFKVFVSFICHSKDSVALYRVYSQRFTLTIQLPCQQSNIVNESIFLFF